ncbi:PH domain-containing protein [Flavobacterium sp.]|uniref:PH domain-containing protein n=1 Tax=Flavobacterium sp. TaxID=239 RepID=UPI002610D817|nr:PH domain-containing protein [Flavobacterium sp.]
MQVYKSKIDIWLLAVVFVPLFAVLLQVLVTFTLGLVAFIAVIIAVMIYMFTTTKYIIDNNSLRVKIGIFEYTQVKISNITAVRKTNNPLSAPALSLKRLEVRYGKNFDYILISPKDRDAFIEDLLKINPSIKVDM